MKKIEIYSSKKKFFLVLIVSLLFVVGGIYVFLNPESIKDESPLFVKVMGLIAMLFFGLGIYVSIKALIKNRLILVIDNIGINVNPEKSSETIEWKNITGFSEIKIQGAKIIIININNSDYWIEKEKNAIKKTMMKFNFNNYRSPFNLSANATQLSHTELMKLLNESLEQNRQK